MRSDAAPDGPLTEYLYRRDDLIGQAQLGLWQAVTPAAIVQELAPRIAARDAAYVERLHQRFRDQTARPDDFLRRILRPRSDQDDPLPQDHLVRNLQAMLETARVALRGVDAREPEGVLGLWSDGPLAAAGWRAALHGDAAENVDARRAVTVLAHAGGSGLVGRLTLEEIQASWAPTVERLTLLADPLAMALIPRSPRFQASLEIAAAAGLAAARALGPCLGDLDRPCLVRWRIEGLHRSDAPPGLSGGSFGAAFAVALALLLRRDPFADDPEDPTRARAALSAAVDADGNLAPVHYIPQKAHAYFARSDHGLLLTAPGNEVPHAHARALATVAECCRILGDLSPAIRQTENERIVRAAARVWEQPAADADALLDTWIAPTVSGQPWHELAAGHRIVLAPGGVGKTALLQAEVLRFNQASTDRTFAVLLHASELPDAPTIVESAARALGRRYGDAWEGYFRQRLAHDDAPADGSGGNLVCIDGLDEGPEALWRRLADALSTAPTGPTAARWLAAARPGGAEPGSDSLLVRLDPFDSERMDQALRRWLPLEDARRLQQQIDSSRALRALLQTPFYLRSACQAIPQSRTGAPLRSRTRLMQSLLDARIATWVRRSQPPPTHAQQARLPEILAEMARRLTGGFAAPEAPSGALSRLQTLRDNLRATGQRDALETDLRDQLDALRERIGDPQVREKTLVRLRTLRDQVDDALQALALTQPHQTRWSVDTVHAAALGTLKDLRATDLYPADRLLQDLHEMGALVEESGALAFPHAILGEFLTAAALAREIRNRGWGAVREEMERLLSAPQHRETLLFLAGSLHDIGPLLAALRDPHRDNDRRTNLATAIHCLIEYEEARPG